MSAGNCGVLVTENGAYYKQKGNNTSWQLIGSGIGEDGKVVAVWG